MGIHLSILEVEADLRCARAILCPPEEAMWWFTAMRRVVRLEVVQQMRLVVGGAGLGENDPVAKERRMELRLVR